MQENPTLVLQFIHALQAYNPTLTHSDSPDDNMGKKKKKKTRKRKPARSRVLLTILRWFHVLHLQRATHKHSQETKGRGGFFTGWESSSNFSYTVARNFYLDKKLNW